MKDEQGRYFEINMQAVEQLEMPVREFVAIHKWKFFLGEEVGETTTLVTRGFKT
jgi:hypothetical protein